MIHTRIVKNQKMLNGSIAGPYICNLKLSCKGDKSLNLIAITLPFIHSDELILCKSCLNYLTKLIDNSILEDAKNGL